MGERSGYKTADIRRPRKGAPFLLEPFAMKAGYDEDESCGSRRSVTLGVTGAVPNPNAELYAWLGPPQRC